MHSGGVALEVPHVQVAAVAVEVPRVQVVAVAAVAVA
jgi:hypothetical protein